MLAIIAVYWRIRISKALEHDKNEKMKEILALLQF